MKTRTTITKLVLLACLSALPICWAQMSNRDSVQDYIDEVRIELIDGKVGLINGVMNLSNDEAQDFWPLYYDYEYELFYIGDSRVELIERFIAAHQAKDLNDLEAKEIAAEWFKQETDRLELLKKYHDLIAKKLSLLHAIQFVQIEHRVNTVIDLMIASEMPLFKLNKVSPAANMGPSSPNLDGAKDIADTDDKATVDKTSS